MCRNSIQAQRERGGEREEKEKKKENNTEKKNLLHNTGYMMEVAAEALRNPARRRANFTWKFRRVKQFGP